MSGRATYRVRQFFRALTAWLTKEDLSDVGWVLTPPQKALFLRMSSADRRHALMVFRALRARGVESVDLLAAALLHDEGKAAASPALGMRVAVVLLGRFAPRLLERLAGGESVGWRRLFVAYRQHAEQGARWAAEAGCSSLTLALIRRHEERPVQPRGEEETLLALLQEADESG